MMKPLLGLFAIVLLCIAVAACGSSATSNTSSTAAAKRSVPKRDRDDDDDNNDDDASVLDYGYAPSADERREIEALVVSYYAASAAEDGAKACTLLMPFVAESVAENLGHNPGLRGKSCAVVMSKLFKLHHTELDAKNATLKFYSVRVGDGRGLIVLSFSVLPEVRKILLRRDSNGSWRLLSLLDGILE
jgi:hypothetical protein